MKHDSKIIKKKKESVYHAPTVEDLSFFFLEYNLVKNVNELYEKKKYDQSLS